MPRYHCDEKEVLGLRSPKNIKGEALCISASAMDIRGDDDVGVPVRWPYGFCVGEGNDFALQVEEGACCFKIRDYGFWAS